ncbi:MAG: hypothetical protein IE909_06500 [Campylobacterales bacterium]|nr:hypothetical protein [Campylobacterales bacterium]
MFAGLSLDQAPPFEAPLKFFLTAPLFCIAGGFLLLNNQNIYLHDLSFVVPLHFITIGFIVMVIFGALLQMLPVVAGAVIKKSSLLANSVYSLIMFSLLSFTVSVFSTHKTFYFFSAIFLFAGLLLFSYVCVYKLFTVQNKTNIVNGLIFSLVSFIVAFLLGIHMFISHGTENFSSFYHIFASLHYNIIFFGFLFLLIASISFQVIPMFWVSGIYQEYEQKSILYTTGLLLIFFTINTTASLNLDLIYKILMGFITIYFAVLTVKKLYDRKRKLKDVTVYFYYMSMISLILGVTLWVLGGFFQISYLILGVFLGLGFVISLINGMIYKIVPFLTWFHLSSRGILEVPTMRDMISFKKSFFQFIVHILSFLFFTVGFLFDSGYMIVYAIVLFIISNLFLFFYLLSCAKLYFTKKGQI